MNKKKERVLLISLIIIIVLIMLLVILYYVKKDKVNGINYYIPSGNWYYYYTELYNTENQISSYISDIDDGYIYVTDSGELNVCYKESDEYVCSKYNYTFEKNVITVEENDTFFSGKMEMSSDEENIIFKNVYDDGWYVLLYLRKEE